MSEQKEILVVDDAPVLITLVDEILSAEGFSVRSANNGEQALGLIATKPPQLILLDIDMPGMDGFEVCLRLKAQEETHNIPIIFLSGLLGLEEKLKGFRLGAVDFISKPFHPEELLARVRIHLELSRLRANLDAQVVERTDQLNRSTEELKKSLEKLNKSMEGMIQVIALTVETRDPYTAGHQRRVAELSFAIAQEMGLPAEKIKGLRMTAMIHDLGKINVPAEILSKPTKLSDLELDMIKVHASVGYSILKDIDFPWPVARIVLEHHERMNGSGYPSRLTGENLLLESRILAVADVVEAIASYRPYRPPFGIEVALDEIEKNKRTLYDSEVVGACLRLFREKGYSLNLSEEFLSSSYQN
jgi:putative two-component system response regulator